MQSVYKQHLEVILSHSQIMPACAQQRSMTMVISVNCTPLQCSYGVRWNININEGRTITENCILVIVLGHIMGVL
jgi:hypothetical protein